MNTVFVCILLFVGNHFEYSIMSLCLCIFKWLVFAIGHTFTPNINLCTTFIYSKFMFVVKWNVYYYAYGYESPYLNLNVVRECKCCQTRSNKHTRTHFHIVFIYFFFPSLSSLPYQSLEIKWYNRK